MDERIQAFLLDVLEDEGKDSDVVRENTRSYLATYAQMFRDQEINERKKDEARPEMSRLVPGAGGEGN